MSGARSYLVCATPRSGSTLLCETLKATGVAGWPDEFFEARFETRAPRSPREYFEEATAPDVSEILGPVRGPRPVAEYSSVLTIDSYDEHLDRTRRLGTTPNGVFGAHVMWDQVDDLVRFARSLPRYRRLPLAGLLHELIRNPRYVWVTRRDKVRQAVSLWRAIQTSAGRDATSVRYDRDAIEHLVSRLHEQDWAWESFFSSASITPLVLVYEDDLAGDPLRAAGRVLDHIGVPAPDLSGRRLPAARPADGLDDAWATRLLTETAHASPLGAA